MEDYNKYFKFKLSEQQKKVFEALCTFYKDENEKIFILRGYAGTGKTSLIGGFIKKIGEEAKNDTSSVQEIEQETQPFQVLASTGRAAKILSDKTNVCVRTIHSLVYVFADLSDDVEKILEEEDKKPEERHDQYGQLLLIFEPQIFKGKTQMHYIVDEASMVSNKKNPSTSNAVFGEGDLLGDLFKYDSKGKFIFVGDPCQLPPVNQRESPALEPDYLRNKFNIKVQEYTLTEIFRQNKENDILQCSFMLRKLWQSVKDKKLLQMPFTPLPLKGYKNIEVYPSEFILVQQYIETVKSKGYNYTSLICNSNKECNYLSNYVRESIHGKQELIIVGDLLLVTQNNYLVDLVNGDLVVVKWIGEKEYRAGMRFVKVEVEELASKHSYRLLLIEDLLTNGQASMDNAQHRRLIIDFVKRMRDRNIKPKTKQFYDMMLSDSYLNALRVTYGYALTCHKSQGGEWNEVFLYLGKSLYRRRSSELYQWAYTAVTRAKKTLHIADNWLVK
jgi:ATP-dependent exoDNAse (exonuclease V) alpha subunit